MKTFITSLFLSVSLSAAAQSLPVYMDETQPIETRVKDALSRMTLEEKTRLSYAQSKFSSPGVPRLGIPEVYYSDGPHGVRMEINWNDWGHSNWTNDYCTAFPALTCLAATWNTSLARQYGKAVGEEALYRKKNMLLGPGVNIFRTPLNGRNFEYMGEDPYLSGSMAAPYIQGLQSNGVSCSLKHYALNNQEQYRGHVDVKVSDRALYEIYLPAFKKAVIEGGAWSVMGSYNQYQNMHCSHHSRLINDILKGEWGFDGVVVSDWGACHDTDQAALFGLDSEMGSYTNGLTSEAGSGYDSYYLGKAYLEKARKGEIPMDVVNEKAARMLRLIFRTTTEKHWGAINSPEHIAVARQIADEGIVLLKNDAIKKGQQPILPLTDERLASLSDGSRLPVILVVGENAERSLCAGGGSSELKAKDEVSPLRGIRERYAGKAEIVFSQGYESGGAYYGKADTISKSLQDSLRDDALAKAKQADLIIYIGGLNKNHFQDCEGGDRLSYNMSYNQDDLISSLIDIQPRTIVTIISGTAIAMPWLKKTPALIQNWYLGSEAGHAFADVLSGDVCPSGKTVFSYAPSLNDYPAHMMGLISYPGVQPEEMEKYTGISGNDNPKSADLLALKAVKKNLPAEMMELNNSTNQHSHRGTGQETQLYNEDILVGYRWFDTMKRPVVFPFGYGLSYTTFQYGKASCSAQNFSATDIEGKKDAILFTLNVKNTGKMEGKEVVQLYIGDDKASVLRPQKELKAFQKVSLAPGEEKTVTLAISAEDLKYFDETKHEWVLEPGAFKAYIGASSKDIKQVVPFSVK